MSDGITDGYRMSGHKPKDIGRGLDPVPTIVEPSENNVDSIAIKDSEKVYATDASESAERKAITFKEWWGRNEELKGDSFLDIGEDYLEWSELNAITYLTAKLKWHKEVTDPLASFLLEHYSTRITHEVHSMYDLAIQIMTEQLPHPTETFKEWDAAYRNGSFMTLGKEALTSLTKDELVVYVLAEREEHRELNRPLYEYVMENHNDSVQHCGSIQAATLDLLRNK